MPGKCLLRYSRTKKRQTRSSKSRKIDILPKGLTHGFGPKMAIFPTFFFRQYRLGKWDFSKEKSSLSWSKIGNCSILFIFGKMGQENVFPNILESKTSFKDYKNSNGKKKKNWDFCKENCLWLRSKIGIFVSFYCKQNRV